MGDSSSQGVREWGGGGGGGASCQWEVTPWLDTSLFSFNENVSITMITS